MPTPIIHRIRGSFTRRVPLNSDQLPSTYSPYSPVSLAKGRNSDLISQLPNELLFAIVEALGEYQPNRLSPIRQLSLVSHRFNQVTNQKLWRTFVIGAGKKRNGLPQTEAALVKKAVQERCDALTRDMTRARFVHNLVIQVSSPGLAHLTRIQRALMAVPNLHTLRIESKRGDDLSPASLARVAGMLAKEQLPFHLIDIECEPPLLFAAPRDMFQFFFAQPTIQSVTISRIRAGPGVQVGGWWPALPNPHRITTKGEHGRREFLPMLRRFRGPTPFARSFLQRQLIPHESAPSTLESVHLIAQHTDYDVESIRNILVASATGPATEPVQGQNTSSTSSSPHLAHVSAFSLWTDGLHDPIDVTPYISLPDVPSHARLPSLLTHAYGIDPASVLSLKLGCTSACFNVHRDMELFPVELLPHFAALESLEWGSAGVLSLGLNGGAGGDAATAARLERKAAMIEFLTKCEALCSTLKRIAFVEHEERLLELVRIRHSSAAGDAPGSSTPGREQGEMPEAKLSFQPLLRGQTAMGTATALDPSLASTTTLNLPSGSMWTMANRSSAPIAFYPAQPSGS
ncbi:hypothetical protein DL93DRAFT_2099496 [Clavulina sp. PMI_390]|nr:hypothetical protein DL93DRAFT_2099496 [Clavulina sp. PMI_390]